MLTFEQEIELQLRDNKILTFEVLNLLKEKYYYSGRPKQVGETVLFCMLEELFEDETEMKIITVHEEEIGLIYEKNEKYYTRTKPNKLPIVKKLTTTENKS